MAAERAYLIVSSAPQVTRRARARARVPWSERAAATRRPRPAPHGPARPRGAAVPAERLDGGLASLVRRTRRPGRHRLGTPGLRPYRPAGRQAGVLPRHPAPGYRCAARHAAGRRGGSLPRYATLLALLAAVVVSGWLAAPGAATFLQLVHL